MGTNDCVKGKKPSPKKMKQFIDRGGYAFLELVGEGITSEEKQMNAWEKHGTITALKEKTQVSRPELYKIKASFPTLKATGALEGSLLPKEKFELLTNATEELNRLEKTLEQVAKLMKHSLVVDSMKVGMRHHILGESIDEAFKNELNLAENKENPIEQLITESILNVNQVQGIIGNLKHSSKKV